MSRRTAWLLVAAAGVLCVPAVVATDPTWCAIAPVLLVVALVLGMAGAAVLLEGGEA